MNKSVALNRKRSSGEAFQAGAKGGGVFPSSFAPVSLLADGAQPCQSALRSEMAHRTPVVPRGMCRDTRIVLPSKAINRIPCHEKMILNKEGILECGAEKFGGGNFLHPMTTHPSLWRVNLKLRCWRIN